MQGNTGWMSGLMGGGSLAFRSRDLPEAIAIVVVAAILASLVAIPFYRRKFMGINWAGMIWLLVSLAVTVGAGMSIAFSGQRQGRYIHLPESANVWTKVIFLFAVPFCVRMFNKWTGPILTEAERLPNGQGVRAWMGPGNVILAVLIALCAWQGFGYSFPAVLAGLLCVVVAYPVVNIVMKQDSAASPAQASASPAGPQSQPAAPDLTEERDRVLRMLEGGKISPDEASELLAALGQAAPVQPAPPTRPAMPLGQKLAIVGAGLVLLGFFLPWATVNLGKEMNKFAGQMQMQPPTTMFLGRRVKFAQVVQPPMPKLKTPTVRIAGADIDNGLGIFILILAIAVPTLPYVVPSLTRQRQFIISLCALALGGVLVLYVLSETGRYISIGLIIVIAGYALQTAGMVKSKRNTTQSNTAPGA